LVNGSVPGGNPARSRRAGQVKRKKKSTFTFRTSQNLR
jgi:hypothetical protein